MRRHGAWLRIAFMLALTAAIGALAGYGGLRLWRDYTASATIDAVSPAGENVADAAPGAGESPAVQSPNPAESAAPSRPSSRMQTAPRRSRPAARTQLQPETAVQFSPLADDDPQSEPDSAAKPSQQPRSTPALPAMPDNEVTLRPQYSIVLDLTKNRQQQALEAASKNLHVVGLKNCSAKYEIKPGEIVIKGLRDVTIAVDYGNLSGGKTQITLEPTIKSSAGKDVPFTIRNMENVRRQIGQAGERAAAQVAAWKAERETLDTYLKATGIVTNAAHYNAARARFEELKKLIPEADKQVAAMKADFDAAEKMIELAKSLSDKCVVLLE
jgi:hypothetical protein